MKALIVEDDLDLRDCIEQLLEMMGIHFLSASNGEIALLLLKDHQVDLLITDFQMPIMDGLDLLRHCRERKYHFPVIFISANLAQVDRERIALEDCCATMITKPMDLEIFEKVIQNSLAKIHHVDCVHWKECKT